MIVHVLFCPTKAPKPKYTVYNVIKQIQVNLLSVIWLIYCFSFMFNDHSLIASFFLYEVTEALRVSLSPNRGRDQTPELKILLHSFLTDLTGPG